MAARMGGMVALALAAALAVTAHASAQASLATPYDDRLNRLAEVLGSIHYLHNLCAEPDNRWREEMEALLAVEQPEPARRARLIASFNRGYRTFDSTYTACTEQARTSANLYVEEGRELALELTDTYGAQ